MRFTIIMALAGVLGLMAGCLHLREAKPAARRMLADQGRTAYVIALARERAPAEQYAAEELARYLKEVTGAEFAIVAPEDRGRRPVIAVGPGAARNLAPDLNLDGLGTDGFVIQSHGQHLILTGGSGAPRGTLYAVYTFLDNIVGVRWWAPGATCVPSVPNLSLAPLDIREKPVFEYREIIIGSALSDQDWLARNRLNRLNYNTWYIDPSSNKPLVFDDKHGGNFIDYGDYFVHTFGKFIPADKQLKEHPDWFGFDANGQRVPGILCLSNPELADVMAQAVKAVLKANPNINIISVSQNDGGRFGCQCPNCRKIDAEEGSSAGSLIRFINGVAGQVEKEYPNVFISTLAYNYTQTCPRQVHPRPNVIVQLCSVGCSFAQPLDDPTNAVFYTDLQGWSKLTDRLYIWNYTGNFANYFRPYPDLYVLGPDLRIFAQNHVRGVFEQGSFASPGAEFQELRSWLLAKLLWNPNQDDRALIREFVSGYYRAAGPYIQEYIDLIQAASEKRRYTLGIGGDDDTNSPFVSLEIIVKADALFAKAFAAVKDQPAVLARVKRAYMPIQCMWLLHYRQWTEEAKTKGLPAPAPWQAILADFTEQVAANKVTRFSEGRMMGGFLKTVPGLIDPPKKGLITASGAYGEQRPENAFDGDQQTSWAAGDFGPQWIQKDLEGPVKIKSIATIFGYGSSFSYQIEGSLDGKTWAAIVPRKTVKADHDLVLLNPAVTFRYVRTTVIDVQGFYPREWIGLAEQNIELDPVDKR